MELSKEKMESFLKNHGEIAKARSDELEWSFKYRTDYIWTSDIFDNVILYLKSDEDFEETINPDELIITPMNGGPELHITEVANISRYCLSDSPVTVPHKWYNNILVESQTLPDELPLDIVSHIVEKKELLDYDDLSSFETVAKNFRLIKQA